MEKMVTRTIARTEAVVMAVNTETGEVSRPVLNFTGALDDEEIMKLLKKTEGTFAYVKVISRKVTNVLYGMPEADFIKYSKVLPPRTVVSD